MDEPCELTATKARRAYSYLETDEYTGGIVFAASNIEARRIGANLLNMDGIGGLEVKRRPDLDQYEATGVPARVLAQQGWHFECHGCGVRIDDCSMEDAGLPLSGIVGYEQGAIYCSHACRMESRAADAATEAFGLAFLDMLKDMVRIRFPGAEIHFGDQRHHHYISRHHRPLVVTQARVSFEWPGQRIGPASLEYHHAGRYGQTLIGPVRPEFMCCTGDRDAFEAFAAKYYPAPSQGGS